MSYVTSWDDYNPLSGMRQTRGNLSIPYEELIHSNPYDILQRPLYNGDIFYFSDNTHLSDTFIDNFINFPWVFRRISSRSWFTCDMILKYKDKSLDWEYLSCESPLEFIFSHLELPWKMYRISWRNDLTSQMVDTYPTLDWDWSSVASKFIDDIEFICKYMYNFSQDVWRDISCVVYPKFALEHQELPWVYEYLSCNNRLRSQDVLDNLQLSWDFTYLITCIDLNLLYDARFRARLDKYDYNSIFKEIFGDADQFVDKYGKEKIKAFIQEFSPMIPDRAVMVYMSGKGDYSILLELSHLDWDWSEQTYICDIEFIKAHPELPWDRSSMEIMLYPKMFDTVMDRGNIYYKYKFS